MRQIISESKFVWRQILFFVTLPILLIQVLFGKKEPGALFQPIKDFFEFIFEAWLTLVLILINICVFIFELANPKIFEALIFQPSYLFSLNFLPMIASWFMHASIVHLAGNMLFLFIFGRVIEQRFGAFKMLFLYIGAGVISSTIAALFGQGGIGASGAIAGLISAAILIKPFYFTYLIIGIPLPIILVGWLAIFGDISGIIVPTNDNIGHFAHLGGYIAISLLVFFLNKPERNQMKKGLILNLLFVGALIAYLYLL
jgi:membrane associated rhomboid family serine protease